MSARTLTVFLVALLSTGELAVAYDGDAQPNEEACSVTLLVQGMMKSRSGAT